jgi:hypothetical protein
MNSTREERGRARYPAECRGQIWHTMNNSVFCPVSDMAMRWHRSVKRNINRENPAVYWEVKIAKNDLPEMWG